MVKGAIYPNGSNFRRVARLDVVARVRKLSQMGLLKERPQWLEWCERVPPMENHNLHLQARTVRNPYRQMVNFLLQKYPDLRFQDCYVDGNDWSAGNDSYRDDHPVMQFVGRQLQLMRTEGLSKKEAFARTEEFFRDRREHLEREQKVMMAMALDAGLKPMFTTGKAYLQAEKARAEAAHLEKIRGLLRGMRKGAEAQMEEETRKNETEKEKKERMEEELNKKLMGFGKFAERTFQDVRENESEYCSWALKQQEAEGPLKVFRDYLRSKARRRPSAKEVERERRDLVGEATPLEKLLSPKATSSLADLGLEAEVPKEVEESEVKQEMEEAMAAQKEEAKVDNIADLKVAEPEVMPSQKPLPTPQTQRQPTEYEEDPSYVIPRVARRAEGVGKMLGQKARRPLESSGVMGEDGDPLDEEDDTAGRRSTDRQRRSQSGTADGDDDFGFNDQMPTSRKGPGRR
eukprot:TRINITY_DN33250_c0_g1_i1.p1 TRINITY_DN33250_c0_g1~~TRINITY_DN33250_c0_g1_i1.p1  ORF type:complete len:460 (-),score=123.16 TRINITY_DN33250_c0_g1_i1:30-1409(-)